MSAVRYLIYGTPVSPFVRKVRMVLALKGVAYDFEEINIFAPPDWFLPLSPLKRIPVLLDRARANATLPDSSAICLYLDREHPDPPLYGANAWEAGRIAWLEEYADTEFAYRLGMGVFRARFMNPRIGKPVDEELAQKTLREAAPRYFDFFTAELGGRDFMVGDALSLADLAICTHFINFGYGGEKVDANRWPKLAAYAERVLSLAPIAAIVEEEARVLGVAR